MTCPKKLAPNANAPLLGAKNGKKIGQRLSIAAMPVEKMQKDLPLIKT
jgi:hypothetical protein